MNEENKELDLSPLFEKPEAEEAENIESAESESIILETDNHRLDSITEIDADSAIPFPGADTKKTEPEIEINADTIIDALYEVDEQNHTKATIVADLSRLHNVTSETKLDNIPDEDREYIEQFVIENCEFAMYSMDGNLFNVTLRFDTEKDAYMAELNQLLKRTTLMQQSIAENDIKDTAAMFSLTLLPDSLEGRGLATMSFPVSYFRVLDDNGVNATMLMQFYIDNLEFIKIDIDEDVRAQMTADAMREVEAGTGGSLFEQ